MFPIAPAWAESTWPQPFDNSWLAEAMEDRWHAIADTKVSPLAFLTVRESLPPRQRAILLLSDVLDRHASETAHLLSISVSAVRSAPRRARAWLSEHDHVDEQKGEKV